MFNITPYSILLGVLISSSFVFIFILFSRSNKFMTSFTLKFFIFILLMVTIRVLFPAEHLVFTKSYSSFKLLPSILNFLQKEYIFTFGNKWIINYTVIGLIYFIWFSVAIILMIRNLYFYIKFSYNFKYVPSSNVTYIKNILEEVCRENNYEFQVKIVIDHNIKNASEFGYFKQTILLPNRVYEEDELRFILSHELCHFDNKTNWWKLLVRIMKAFFWWNPLFTYFENSIDSILEIYCDATVTEGLDHNAKIRYLQCILKSLRVSNEKHNNYKFMNAFAKAPKKNFNNNLLKRRFALVIQPKRNNKFLSFLAYVTLLVFFVVSYRYVIQPAYMTPYEKFFNFEKNTTSLVLNSENDSIVYFDVNDNVFIIYEDGKYMLYENFNPIEEVNYDDYKNSKIPIILSPSENDIPEYLLNMAKEGDE